MGFIEKIAEERIRIAEEEGLFNNLRGQGKPLPLDDDSGIPEDLRMAHKILKNAGFLPEEMELRKRIQNLRQLLNAATADETQSVLRRELNLLLLKETISRGK